MNSFDHLQVNLNDLYEAVVNSRKELKKTHTPALLNMMTMYWHGLLIKIGIRKRLLYGGFILGWFQEFFEFWNKFLKGRPIDVIDFHYLRVMYRSKFQSIKHSNENSDDQFLAAWQQPENVYLLFAAVWKYAKTNYLDFYQLLKYLPPQGNILEYGCGIAPITIGLIRYLPHRNDHFKICDILQINFVYAMFTIGKYPQVNYELLTPYHNILQESHTYDAIVCLTVLEHVPNPIEVVQSFHGALREGGKLIFDYILSEGSGLDSKNSANQRAQVLDFIENHFVVMYGEIKRTSDMGLTVATKK